MIQNGDAKCARYIVDIIIGHFDAETLRHQFLYVKIAADSRRYKCIVFIFVELMFDRDTPSLMKTLVCK